MEDEGNAWVAQAVKRPTVYFFFFSILFIFEREGDRTRVGERQRERETQKPKQAPGSELSAQSLTRGSNPPGMRW